MMAARRTTEWTTLGDLLGADARGLAGLAIGDLVLDGRDARPGAAFVAVRGGRSHGLAFAEQAAARGAAVVLYEPPTDAPAGAAAAADSRAAAAQVDGAAADRVLRRLRIPALAVPGLRGRLGELAEKLYGPSIAVRRIAGVTGTNGKTTVAYLAAQAATRVGAKQSGRACGYLGTLGYGVPPALTAHALTTPDCFTLHRELASLDAESAVLEVSSHALAQDRAAGLTIATAAFTNLTRDHLDAHGDFERYGLAKARLFARPELRRAVLNVADPFAVRLLERLAPGVEALRVRAVAAAGAEGDAAGSAPAADLEARVEDLGLRGLVLHIGGRFGTARLVSRLVGGFNAENLVVALGLLLAWDVPLAEASAALGAAAAPPGRLEVVGGGERGPTVVVDYAHTPDGLERVLGTLAAVTRGDLWCVFGCGGDRDRGKRPLMGAVAARLADRIVLTDDNPRGEDPEAIVADIVAGLAVEAPGAPGAPGAPRTPPPPARLEVEHDRRRAIEAAIRAAGPQDVVLVAGKGHEREQIVGDARRPFSDLGVARAALAAHGVAAAGGPPNEGGPC